MTLDFDGLLDWLLAMFRGWWFLISPSYRAKKRKEWKKAGAFEATLQIIVGILGMLLSIAIVAGIIFLLRYF